MLANNISGFVDYVKTFVLVERKLICNPARWLLKSFETIVLCRYLGFCLNVFNFMYYLDVLKYLKHNTFTLFLLTL